jgi:hypothetical protein
MESEARHARLAAVERELAELGAQHDLAMSAFKFDEARDVQQRIAVLERERAELVAVLPVPVRQPPATPAPVFVAPRRHRRSRRC